MFVINKQFYYVVDLKHGGRFFNIFTSSEVSVLTRITCCLHSLVDFHVELLQSKLVNFG